MLVYGNQFDVVLAQRHQELFFTWLGLDLATQGTEVAQYLEGVDADQNVLVEPWIQERLYKS